MPGRGEGARSVGLVAERKPGERRVALTPTAVDELVGDGHDVLVEAGSGVGAGFDDDAYAGAGAHVVAAAEEAWAADLVVKVKEPQCEEYRHLREGLELFCYLHLAADPGLAAALVHSRTTALAFETLTEVGSLPLLAPMSDIAGRTAAIVAAEALSSDRGGRGVLLGGAPGVPPAHAVVIGLGRAGTSAARGLRGLGARVTGVDLSLERLREALLEGSVDGTHVSSPAAIGELVTEADVVIGAALVPGARAPRVLSRAQVAAMRPGAVIVDLAIDQGGCVETARPTSLDAPTYVEEDVVHYCVTNVPGRYPWTASRALSAALTPWVRRFAREGGAWRGSGADNAVGGRITNDAVASSLGWRDAAEAPPPPP